MFRSLSLVVAVALAHSACCELALADPDMTAVRAAIGAESSSVVVAGRSRVDVVAAVLRGLEKCKRPSDRITVGPWLRFPEQVAKDKAADQPKLTVVLGEGVEGEKSSVYIAVTPNFPFSIVTTISTELRTCGFPDVRLLSDDQVVSEFMTLSAADVPQTRPIVTHNSETPKKASVSNSN